jgi:hypothetical protein
VFVGYFIGLLGEDNHSSGKPACDGMLFRTQEKYFFPMDLMESSQLREIMAALNA